MVVAAAAVVPAAVPAAVVAEVVASEDDVVANTVAADVDATMDGQKDQKISVALCAEKGETTMVIGAGPAAHVALSGWLFVCAAFDSSDLHA